MPGARAELAAQRVDPREREPRRLVSARAERLARIDHEIALARARRARLERGADPQPLRDLDRAQALLPRLRPVDRRDRLRRADRARAEHARERARDAADAGCRRVDEQRDAALRLPLLRAGRAGRERLRERVLGRRVVRGARRDAVRSARRARWLAALLLSLPLSTSGCYLAHLARGQMRLLCARVPVEELLRAPDTPAELRAQFARVAEVRRYAEQLGLAVGGRYTDYAPWPGDSVVTTVVATRPGEVEPVTTWFPIVGSVPYRGYFDAERAAAEAARLRAKDLDVCEQKVRAYSTLGWFDDPLTGPMLRQDEATLVETLFHELLHATVFVPGDPEFNEGVAAFFGQEARVRFYARARRRRRAARASARSSPSTGACAPRSSRCAAPWRSSTRRSRPAPRARRGARSSRPRRARGSRRSRSRGTTPPRVAARAAARRRVPRDLGHLPRRHGGARRRAPRARRRPAAFLARVKQAAEADDPRAALLGEPHPSMAAPRAAG